MSEPVVYKAVTLGTGDPSCLHCRLGQEVKSFVEARPQQVHSGEILLALMMLAGEVILHAPEAIRADYLRRSIEELSMRAGIASTVRETAPQGAKVALMGAWGDLQVLAYRCEREGPSTSLDCEKGRELLDDEASDRIVRALVLGRL